MKYKILILILLFNIQNIKGSILPILKLSTKESVKIMILTDSLVKQNDKITLYAQAVLESGYFKYHKYNNIYGIMKKNKLKKYNSIAECYNDRIKIYFKKNCIVLSKNYAKDKKYKKKINYLVHKLKNTMKDYVENEIYEFTEEEELLFLRTKQYTLDYDKLGVKEVSVRLANLLNKIGVPIQKIESIEYYIFDSNYLDNIKYIKVILLSNKEFNLFEQWKEWLNKGVIQEKQIKSFYDIKAQRLVKKLGINIEIINEVEFYIFNKEYINNLNIRKNES